MLDLPQTRIDVQGVLAHNALLDKEVHRLLGLVRVQSRELAEFRGENPDQAELGLLGSLKTLQVDVGKEEKPPKLKAKPNKQRGHGPTPQPELPQIQVRFELDEAERTCLVCDGTMVPMIGQTEDSEVITIEMKRVLHIHQRRQKYRCACNGAVRTAPAPRKLIPGGRYLPEFAVDVAVSKYVDHCPLERQVKRFAREGLKVTRQALWDQVCALGEALGPTAEAIRERILSSAYLHADETGFRLVEKGKGVKRKTLWVLSTKDHAWYTISGKSYEDAKPILGSYEGTVISDAYAVYPQLARAGPLRLAHCWSHVLRKFRDTLEHRRRESGEILEMIGELYAIEKAIDREGETSVILDRTAEARTEHTKPLLKRIKGWALSQTGPPRSKYMMAVKYLLRFWDGLVVFASDPMIPPDNNAAERALRGPVLGRKNYLQFRSAKGCEVASILYTVCESAKLQGVPAERYLREAVSHALEQRDGVLLPENFAARN